jgi:S-formylglutathione hydrolase FrmB
LLSLLLALPLSIALADSGRGEVRTDTLWSQSLGVRKPVTVYLPPSYGTRPAARYPVAYWLHGLYGAQDDWVKRGKLAETMDSLVARGAPEMIVVMPDGDDGWYTTWNRLIDVGACRRDRTRAEPAATYCVPWPHYDDYVARDLVAWTDSTFRTLADPAHRGIGGLSMGGYGAVTLALNYPDVFSAAASHSGVLAPLVGVRRPGTTAPPARPDIAQVARAWGGLWPRLAPAFGSDTMGWWARDPGRLAERARQRSPARLPRLFMDVGRDDPYADQTRAFHRALLDLGIAHRYAEWPGAHDWKYWSGHLGESLEWMGKQIGR